MRNFILASAMALAATLSTGFAARADDMSMHNMHNMHHQHCMMKTVSHRDGHGHMMMKKMRVCR
jgi:hypothetical protein